MLFEKTQHTGDCGLTGRSAATDKTSRCKAIAVNKIQEEK